MILSSGQKLKQILELNFSENELLLHVYFFRRNIPME